MKLKYNRFLSRELRCRCARDFFHYLKHLALYKSLRFFWVPFLVCTGTGPSVSFLVLQSKVLSI